MHRFVVLFVLISPFLSAQDARIRVAEDARNIVSRVEPVYPSFAREMRISGIVKFAVIVAKDGTVQNLRLISGHPLLVASAAEAVKQ